LQHNITTLFSHYCLPRALHVTGLTQVLTNHCSFIFRWVFTKRKGRKRALISMKTPLPCTSGGIQKLLFHKNRLLSLEAGKKKCHFSSHCPLQCKTKQMESLCSLPPLQLNFNCLAKFSYPTM